jgi:hypothetical protein
LRRRIVVSTAAPPGGGLISGGTDFGPLASRLQGAVMVPGAAGCDSVRLLYDDIKPTALVRCASAADARPRSPSRRTGHCPSTHCGAGHSTTTGAVRDVKAMNSVTSRSMATAPRARAHAWPTSTPA